MQFLRTFTEIPVDQWDALVLRSSTASFFQTPSCFRFYSDLQFLKPFVFGVSEEGVLKGIICGYLVGDGNVLKQFFSRRAIVPGGIMLDDTISEKALSLLLKEAVRIISKKAIYLEFRNYTDYSAYRNTFESSGFEYQLHLNFQVSTPDIETANKNLSSTKRRDVKLSQKNGVEWMSTDKKEDVIAYYQLLLDLYKNKIKVPLFPFEFFEKIVAIPEAKLFVVRQNEQIIGGSLCVLLPNRTVYEWFVCGQDGLQKNIFPSTVATWAGIEYAAMNNFTSFDMMGAGKPEEGYGVRDFKARFGGELVENGRFLHINNHILYSLGKYVIQKLKSM